MITGVDSENGYMRYRQSFLEFAARFAAQNGVIYLKRFTRRGPVPTAPQNTARPCASGDVFMSESWLRNSQAPIYRGWYRLEMNGAASWPRSARYQEAAKSTTMQAEDQKNSRTGKVAVSR